MADVKTWLIGTSGCLADDVTTYRVTGTKDQVKKHLLSLIKADINEDDSYDYGTDKLKELEERPDGSIYGYAVFSDYHNDYTARPDKEPLVLLGDSFIDDYEKIIDFCFMSKEEFLRFYTYLTENDYTATIHEAIEKSGYWHKEWYEDNSDLDGRALKDILFGMMLTEWLNERRN